MLIALDITRLSSINYLFMLEKKDLERLSLGRTS
jgi:hypothetical protein